MPFEINEISCVAVGFAPCLYRLSFGIRSCMKYRWENLILVRFGCTLRRNVPVLWCVLGGSNCGICASLNGGIIVATQSRSRVSGGLSCSKVKYYYLSTPWRYMWGVEVQIHSFFTSAQGGGEWSTARAWCFAPCKEHRCQLSRSLGGPQSRSVRFCRDSSPDLPACYLSLLRYLDLLVF